MTKSKQQKYKVEQNGSICDASNGGLLYDLHSLEGMSIKARRRLAQLHTQNSELEWEGSNSKKGAWTILVEEGLMTFDP